MKSASNSATLIAIAAAVALWLVATLFDDDSRWLPDPPETEAANAAPTGAPNDTPLRTATDAAGCAEAEVTIAARVDAARYCVSDDDCTLFDYGYPIQCLTSVAKTQITGLRREYRRYAASCAYRVYYDCPTGDMHREPVCRSNRCTVELATDDVLQDETLRYLGIKDSR